MDALQNIQHFLAVEFLYAFQVLHVFLDEHHGILGRVKLDISLKSAFVFIFV